MIQCFPSRSVQAAHHPATQPGPWFELWLGVSGSRVARSTLNRRTAWPCLSVSPLSPFTAFLVSTPFPYLYMWVLPHVRSDCCTCTGQERIIKLIVCMCVYIYEIMYVYVCIHQNCKMCTRIHTHTCGRLRACLRVCVCVLRTSLCVHTHIHTYMHACIHSQEHTYMHTHIHTYIHADMRTCIHTHISTCIRTYIHTYIYSLPLYTYTYMYIYVHTYYLYIYISNFLQHVEIDICFSDVVGMSCSLLHRLLYSSFIAL